MKSIAETLVSPYRGSEQTYEMVKEQVRERWGDKVAETFDPHRDAMPFSWWIKQGYAVKKGSKALKSVTIVEVKDDEGKIIRTFPRSVNLFHRKQVEPIHA